MKTKRTDMESFRGKALSNPAVREEYETLDAYYKTQRQLSVVIVCAYNMIMVDDYSDFYEKRNIQIQVQGTGT